MYNGIGLTTPRGSGTNGYIQTNKFFVRPRPLKSEQREFGEGQGQGGVSRKANSAILEHDRKRQIELKCTELEQDLLEQGFGLDEVAEQVLAARKVLEAFSNEGEVGGQDEMRTSVTQTHQVAAKKEKQLDIMKAALGLDEIKEGEAFDRELQDQRKQDRVMAREEKERERKEKKLEIEKAEREREKDLKRKAKAEAKEKERAEKDLRRQEKKERRRKEEAALREAEEDRKAAKRARKDKDREDKYRDRDRDRHRHRDRSRDRDG